MQAFGHTVLAWMWLDVALASQSVAATAAPASQQYTTDLIAARAGITASNQYFYHYELPKIDAWLAVVSGRDMTCADMPENAF
jgi:Acetyl-CoA dehydrogenase C-terminal like